MLMVSKSSSGEFNFCSVKKLWFNLYLLGEQSVDQFNEVLDSEQEGDQFSVEACCIGVYVSSDVKPYIIAIG